MSTKVVVRICGYVISFGSLISAQVISAVGVDQTTTSRVLTIVGFGVGLATLIKGTLDTATPKGFEPVITPKSDTPVTAAVAASTPPVLTTAAAVKANP